MECEIHAGRGHITFLPMQILTQGVDCFIKMFREPLVSLVAWLEPCGGKVPDEISAENGP